MPVGLLNQSAPQFLPAEWNGSFCAIATDSGPSNFGQTAWREFVNYFRMQASELDTTIDFISLSCIVS